MWNVDSLVDKWTNRRFLMRSGYYAGRGPNSGDLNSKILESIYQGIKEDIGQEEASNFVRFVNQLDDLSASAFIVAFEQFAAQDGRVVSIEQRAGDGMRLDTHGDALLMQGFGAVMSAMGGQKRSEKDHWNIKGSFIRQHETEIPGDERRSLVGSIYEGYA